MYLAEITIGEVLQEYNAIYRVNTSTSARERDWNQIIARDISPPRLVTPLFPRATDSPVWD